MISPLPIAGDFLRAHISRALVQYNYLNETAGEDIMGEVYYPDKE